MKKSPTATAITSDVPTSAVATATDFDGNAAIQTDVPDAADASLDVADVPADASLDVAVPSVEVTAVATATVADRIRAEFHTLGDIAPSLTVDALMRSDGYDALVSRIKRGYTLLDAYVLSCVKDAFCDVDGRSHLTATALYGKTQSSPPSDVARLYRLYMPKTRIGEIEKNYNEYLGKIKKGRR